MSLLPFLIVTLGGTVLALFVRRASASRSRSGPSSCSVPS